MGEARAVHSETWGGWGIGMRGYDDKGVFQLADMELSQHDRVLHLLYAAVLDSDKWVEVLHEMRALFAANSLTLILREPSADDPGLLIWVGNIAGEDVVRFVPARQFATSFINLLADHVYTIADLMEVSAWRGSGYFLHWCAPHDVFHVMLVDILTAGAGRLPLRITRRESEPAFSAQDRARCQVLLPHLRQALQMHNERQRQESLGGLFSSAIGRLSVGVIVLDARGRVFDQNLMAAQMLASGDGLKLVSGGLEAFYPSDNRALQNLIRGAFAHHASGVPALVDAVSIARPSGQLSLGVVAEVVPPGEHASDRGKPVAVLYVRDPSSPTLASAGAIRQLFNLTPSETALALKLVDGASLEEVAEELSIRRNTARAHLRSIFSKTGVRRQTELVRILLNSVAPLRAVD